VRQHALRRGLAWWSLSPFALDPEASSNGQGSGADERGSDPIRTESDQIVKIDIDLEHDPVETAVVSVQPATHYRGDTEQAIADIRTWLSAGWRVVFVTEGHGPAERLVEVLGSHDLAARFDEDLESAP